MFSSSYVWLGFYYYCTDSNFHQYKKYLSVQPYKAYCVSYWIHKYESWKPDASWYSTKNTL